MAERGEIGAGGAGGDVFGCHFLSRFSNLQDYRVEAGQHLLAFGLAHMYQGPVGILRTGFAGSLMALLYGLTGSLWAPIVAHAMMDLSAGRMSHAAFSTETPEDTVPDMAA